MDAETKITVTVPADLIGWLEARVADGEYVSIDAAVEAAVRNALARQAEQSRAANRLHELLDEAEKGPWFDGEEVFRELIEECEADMRAKGP
jgi:Arc/MetJ-type ribon-helix-helix transcriptional regulator